MHKLLAIIIIAIYSINAVAEIKELNIEGTFDFSQAQDIVVGDRFRLVLRYDDAVTDFDSSTTRAFFNDAVKSFSFFLIDSPSGTYAGGSTTSPEDFIAGSASDDSLILFAEGVPFEGFVLEFRNSLGTFLNDTGLGQTINEMVQVPFSDPNFSPGAPSSPSPRSGSFIQISGAQGFIESIIVSSVSDGSPVAVAGDDQSFSVGDTVFLNGSNSFDDNTASASLLYQWIITSKPVGSNATLTGDNTATPSFVADLDGTYLVELVVTDEEGLSSTVDQVEISNTITQFELTIEGTFDLSEVQDIVVGDRFRLVLQYDEAVTDSDSSTSRAFFYYAVKSFSFSLIDSPSGTYAGGSITSPQDFIGLKPPRSGYDVLFISRNSGNFPDLGGLSFKNFSLDLNNGTDTFLNDTGLGQTIKEMVQVPFSDPSLIPDPPLGLGSYFGIFNTDDFGAQGFIESIIISGVSESNEPPVARAGNDQSIRAGDSVFLDGSNSFDDNTASASLLYQWTITSNPAGSNATLTGANTATPSFIADVAGTYAIDLIVTDAEGLSSTADQVEISSDNLAPTANAGDDQLVIIGDTVILDGSSSTDPEDDPLTYGWSITSAPSGSLATLSDPNTETTSFVPDVAGVYLVTLTVSDFFGPGTPDSVKITVTAAVSFAEQLITDANVIVETLSSGQVTTRGNQQAFQNLLSQAIKSIQQGNLSTAIDKLEWAILRTDGCVLRGSPDTNSIRLTVTEPLDRDWILDCSVQTEVYTLLNDALEALELLLPPPPPPPPPPYLVQVQQILDLISTVEVFDGLQFSKSSLIRDLESARRTLDRASRVSPFSSRWAASDLGKFIRRLQHETCRGLDVSQLISEANNIILTLLENPVLSDLAIVFAKVTTRVVARIGRTERRILPRVLVRNTGYETVKNFDVKFRMRGPLTSHPRGDKVSREVKVLNIIAEKWVPPLYPNTNSYWTGSAGNYELCAIVDPNNRIIELDEVNNVFVFPFIVQPRS